MLGIRLLSSRVWVALLLLIGCINGAVAQEDELSKWLRAQKYKERVSPGSFSLLGYIYDTPDLASLQATASECFAADSLAMRAIQGPRQEHETDSYDSAFKRTDLAAFLKLAGAPSSSQQEVGRVEAELRSKGVKFAAVSLTRVSSKALSSYAIVQGLNSNCKLLMESHRDWIISEALGVREMKYEFYGASGEKIALPLRAVALLGEIGLGQQKDHLMWAEYDHPVWIGFKVVRLCKNGSYRSSCHDR